MFNYETKIGPSAPHRIRRLDYKRPTKYESGDGVTGQNQEGKKETLRRRRKNTHNQVKVAEPFVSLGFKLVGGVILKIVAI